MLTFVALLSALTWASSTDTASAAQRHKVRIHHGQTLSGLHHRFHRSVRCIAKRNHIRNPNRVRAGRHLVIPTRRWCRHHHGHHHKRHHAHRHHRAHHQRVSRSGSRARLKRVQTRPAFKSWARAHVGHGQFPALNKLWNHESGWNHHAANPSSGAYGIPQALPGSKMASAGGDWRSNGYTQMRWGLHYIRARYGSAVRAWSFWQRHHWY